MRLPPGRPGWVRKTTISCYRLTCELHGSSALTERAVAAKTLGWTSWAVPLLTS
jgi:hypothetical protein